MQVMPPDKAEQMLAAANAPSDAQPTEPFQPFLNPETPGLLSWIGQSGEVESESKPGDLVAYLTARTQGAGEEEATPGAQQPEVPQLSPEEQAGMEITQEADRVPTVDMDRVAKIGAKHGLVFDEKDLAKQEDINEKLNKNILVGAGSLRASLAIIFGEAPAPPDWLEPTEAIKELNDDFNTVLDILDDWDGEACIDFDDLQDQERIAVDRFTLRNGGNDIWYGGYKKETPPSLLKQVATDNTHRMGSKGKPLSPEGFREVNSYGVKLHGAGKAFQKNEKPQGGGLSPQGRIVQKLHEAERCNGGGPMIRQSGDGQGGGGGGLAVARGAIDEELMQATPALMKVLSLPGEASDIRRRVLEALVPSIQSAITKMSKNLAAWTDMVDLAWNSEDSDAIIVGEEAEMVRKWLDHLPWAEMGAEVEKFQKMARLVVLQFLKDNIQAFNAILAPVKQSDLAGVVQTINIPGTNKETKVSDISGTRAKGKSVLGATGHSQTAEAEKADTLLAMKTPEAAVEVTSNFGGIKGGVRGRLAELLGHIGVSQKCYGPEIKDEAAFDSHVTDLGKMSVSNRATQEADEIWSLQNQALKERAEATGREYNQKAADAIRKYDKEQIEYLNGVLGRPGDATDGSNKSNNSLGNLIAELEDEFKSVGDGDGNAREMHLLLNGCERSSGGKTQYYPGLKDLQTLDPESTEYKLAKADMLARIPILRAAERCKDGGRGFPGVTPKAARGAYFAYQLQMAGTATSECLIQARVLGGRTYTTSQSALNDELCLKAMNGEIDVRITTKRVEALGRDGKKLAYIDSRRKDGAAKAHVGMFGRAIRNAAEQSGIVQERKANKLMVMFAALLEEMGLRQA